jgi:branched-subunit amino acid ABC-type transport system permease component
VTLFLQLLANGVASGCLFALIAVGFSLIYATGQIFHLAHGATYLAAGYGYYYIVVQEHLNILLGVVFAAVVAVVFGMIVDTGIYQPMRKVSRSFFSMFVASFGVVIVVSNIVPLLFGAQTVSLGPSLSMSVQVGSLLIPRGDFAAAGAAIVAVLLLRLLLTRTRTGTGLRALANNHDLVDVAGLPRARLGRVAMIVGSLTIVPAAILSGYLQGLSPGSGVDIGTVAIAGALVGGVGSISGACVAGMILGVAESLATWKLPGNWAEAIGFGLLLILLVLKPSGLFASLAHE